MDDITFGPLDDTTSSPSDDTASGPLDNTTSGPSDDTASGPLDNTTSGPLDDTASAPLDSTASSPLDASGPLDNTASGTSVNTTSGTSVNTNSDNSTLVNTGSDDDSSTFWTTIGYGLSGQQLAMGSTKNVKILPFDEGPPKVLVLSCSSLDCLPFDHGPNQVLTLCHVNENLTLKVICCLNIHSACDLSTKMWSPSNANDDSVLMNNLCWLLKALPFDGCYLICDPRSHTDSVVDCLDHGEECTELHIECTSECAELCIHSSVVQIRDMNCFLNDEDVDTHVLGKHHVIMAGGTTNFNKGPVILIMWQYALTDMGESINSLLQMDWYQVHIDDMSVKVGGINNRK